MPVMTRAGYVPPKGPKASKKPKKGKKRGRGGKRRGIGAAGVVSLLVFAVAALIGAGTLWLFSRTAQYLDAFLPGTYLLGGSLGGLTYEEGVSLLHAMTDEAVSGWHATITAQGETYELTAQDVALSLDADATLEPLWAEGRGGMLPAFRAMLALGAQPRQAELSLSYDMDAADALLERIRTAVEREPVDATARFLPGSSEPFRYTQEAVGYSLDTAPLRERLIEALSGLVPAEIEAQPKEIAPEVYSADLRAATVLRGRAVVTAEDASGFLNAQLAAAALSGRTLEPGETLSFNEAVGARTAARGYVSAPEPAYGDNVEGVGGGVCQTATALYQAALLGCVEVTAHSAAARPVPYADAGLEAAVSGQGLDLALRNDTGMPLYVAARAYMDGELACVEAQLIGAPLRGRCMLETTLEEIAAPEEPVYVRDSEGRYATYTDERVHVLDARPGCRSRVERVTLDESGVEKARETVFEGEYAPQPEAIYVGVNARQ